MQPVLVTGGTGTLGRVVVAELHARGAAVRVLSRRARVPTSSGPQGADDLEWVTGDLRTGAGLAEAVRDVSAVVHCATDVRRPRSDVEGARRLLAAAREAGRPHLVYVSIVGVDRISVPYYRVKLEVERLVETCGLPWTVLRATQFHDLVESALRLLARLPVLVLPAGTDVQPVDVGDVAPRLVDVALAPAAGRVLEIGGPQVRSAPDLARAYLRATARRRPLLPIRVPGQVARAYRQGAHLTPQHAAGQRTFEDHLAERQDRS